MIGETQTFLTGREGFLRWLKEWESELPAQNLAEIIAEAGGPDRVAIICIDITLCFARVGPLSSPRIDALVPRIVDLFKLAHSMGIRDFVLSQDAHPPDSPEFEAYGPHCVAGTPEAETVPELKELPFADTFAVLPKRALNPGIAGPFVEWLEGHPSIRRFVVVGDCTDLCVYQVAMHLKIRANQFYLDYDVIVPASCVDTFDTPLEKAQRLPATSSVEAGILPHDADLLHPLFLYHMALNDIQVVREIA